MVSRIASGFLNHVIMCPQLIIMMVLLDKNSQAVTKGAALFKMASIKKVMKSKLAAKKWL